MTAGRLRGSSGRWLARQQRDAFVARATAEGYRSRAAYKLLDIQRKFRVLKLHDRVVDLGAAPGSWTQVAAEICRGGRAGRVQQGSTTAAGEAAAALPSGAAAAAPPRRRVSVLEAAGLELRKEQAGAAAPPLPPQPAAHHPAAARIVGVDLTPVEPMLGAKFLVGDLTLPSVQRAVLQALNNHPADCVLSDMAHSFTGSSSHDATQQVILSWNALLFCGAVLSRGGNAVIKVRHGSEYARFLRGVQARFRRALEYKPPASRSESAEAYIIGMGFLGERGARGDAEERELLDRLGVVVGAGQGSGASLR